MRQDFEDYQKRKREERNRLVTGAQRAANVYKDLIESVGEELEVPREVSVVDFMEWLANELATMNDYMTTGREYASFVSLCAFARALEEGGCDHLEKFEIKDP
jgi:transcription initiation factor TFIIIB Brf1 subunit/transcription initiation factor TFIIB